MQEIFYTRCIAGMEVNLVKQSRKHELSESVVLNVDQLEVNSQSIKNNVGDHVPNSDFFTVVVGLEKVVINKPLDDPAGRCEVELFFNWLDESVPLFMEQVKAKIKKAPLDLPETNIYWFYHIFYQLNVKMKIYLKGHQKVSTINRVFNVGTDRRSRRNNLLFQLLNDFKPSDELNGNGIRDHFNGQEKLAVNYELAERDELGRNVAGFYRLRYMIELDDEDFEQLKSQGGEVKLDLEWQRMRRTYPTSQFFGVNEDQYVRNEKYPVDVTAKVDYVENEKNVLYNRWFWSE